MKREEISELIKFLEYSPTYYGVRRSMFVFTPFIQPKDFAHIIYVIHVRTSAMAG